MWGVFSSSSGAYHLSYQVIFIVYKDLLHREIYFDSEIITAAIIYFLFNIFFRIFFFVLYFFTIGLLLFFFTFLTSGIFLRFLFYQSIRIIIYDICIHLFILQLFTIRIF